MRNPNRREVSPRELARQRRKEQIQRRRLIAILCVLGLVIIIVVLAATCSGGGTGGKTATSAASKNGTTTTTLGAATFTAHLSGDNTSATGTFTMAYDPDSETLSFNLKVEGLEAPSTATIYQKGDDGSENTVYTLFAGPAEKGSFSGVLAQGFVDEESLAGPLDGGTSADLIALIRSGKAYVSVGTTSTPVDALTGVISETTGETVSTAEGAAGTSSSDQSETTTTAKKSTSTTKKKTTTTK